ncbi:PREDICTED: neuropeptide Y receptor type 2-like [Nicrophorus vespilloides]|uniref:Neuropeptide Y receptor type 2-like n=1 Tax=Nicrophorus vespilloides TaxID=110193 RepID=A0ABM1N739_NICVS|nr:PREDICTED: neuropeptide Y receptor type 2-like [Nicrophorus vespilloides]
MTPWNSSYVFGHDNVSGWGGRYFFTYFNQLGDRSTSLVAFEVAVFAIIFLVSIVTNIAIATCVFRYPDMKTVTNNFVLNLAAADLLFAFSIPAVAYSRVTPFWVLGDVACKLIPYTQFVSGIVLLWTLTLISMDRYRCIVVPPYRSKITTKQASLYSGLTWVLTSAIFIPVPLWFRQQETEDGGFICTMIFPKSEAINYALCFIIPVLMIACLMPMIVLVYNYHRIFKKILSTKNTWATSCVMVSSDKKEIRRQSEVSMSDIFAPWPRKFSNSQMSTTGRHGSLSHHEELRLHKHIRVVRVLFLNVIVVLIMWLPITLVMLLIFLDGRRPTEDRNFFLRSYHFIASLVIAFLNTVVNPLLYGVLSDNFRSCLMKLCCNSDDHQENTKIIRENATFTPSSCRNFGSYKTAIKQSSINSVSENPNDVV